MRSASNPAKDKGDGDYTSGDEDEDVIEVHWYHSFIGNSGSLRAMLR